MKLETVRAVALALNTAGVKCLFVGGFAVVAHGYGRMTYDIDLVLQLDRENILRAFGVFDGLGYAPRVCVRFSSSTSATSVRFHSPRRSGRSRRWHRWPEQLQPVPLDAAGKVVRMIA